MSAHCGGPAAESCGRGAVSPFQDVPAASRRGVGRGRPTGALGAPRRGRALARCSGAGPGSAPGGAREGTRSQGRPRVGGFSGPGRPRAVDGLQSASARVRASAPKGTLGCEAPQLQPLWESFCRCEFSPEAVSARVLSWAQRRLCGRRGAPLLPGGARLGAGTPLRARLSSGHAVHSLSVLRAPAQVSAAGCPRVSLGLSGRQRASHGAPAGVASAAGAGRVGAWAEALGGGRLLLCICEH